MRAIDSTQHAGRCKTPSADSLPSPYSDPALPAGARLLARALRDEWARDKEACWPSDRTIAEKTGLSTGHAQRCLRLLERAGYIRRRTDAVRRPDGRVVRRRVILLLWPPRPRADVRARPAPAREGSCAPAPGQNLVIGTGKGNPDPRTLGRPRSGPREAGPGSLASALAQVLHRAVPAADTSTPNPASPASDSLPAMAASGPSRGRAPASPPEADPRPGAPVSSPCPAPPTWPEASPPAGTPGPGADEARLAGVLDGAQRTRLRELPEPTRRRVVHWLGLGDPICLREAYRLLSPAPPCEPPSSSRPTRELLGALPGRHDLVAAATQRLAEELSDLGSWSYYRKVASSVASRERPAEALIACWSQATGGRARRPGALFASVWKKSPSMRC